MTRTLRSNWLDLALTALVAIAEGAMIAPWLHFLSGGLHHGATNIPSPVVLTLVGFILYWCARYFLDGGWDISAARALSLASWLVLMIIWYGAASGHLLTAPWHFIDRLVRADTSLIFILIVGGVAWWRSLMLASNPAALTPEFARRLIWRAVFVAGAALVLALMMGGETGEAVSNSAILAFPLLLLASLLAAGVAQAKAARAAIHSGADPARVGLTTASGITFGLILVAVGVAGLAGKHFWSQLAEPLRWLQTGFETILYVVLVGAAYAVFIVLWPLIWALQQLQGKPPPQQPVQQNGAGNVKDQLQHASNPLPHGLTVALELTLLAVLIGLVIWLILRSLRRYLATQAETGVDEVHESVWSSDLALQQLRSFLSGLGRHRGGPSARPFNLDSEPVDVRDAYRHLLALGEREGYARRPNESASDYLARLRLAWSNSDEPLDDLTVRYLAARYADQSSEDDLTHARRDWHQLRQRFARG